MYELEGVVVGGEADKELGLAYQLQEALWRNSAFRQGSPIDPRNQPRYPFVHALIGQKEMC